jgi:hypothetical protein
MKEVVASWMAMGTKTPYFYVTLYSYALLCWTEIHSYASLYWVEIHSTPFWSCHIVDNLMYPVVYWTAHLHVSV